MTSKTKKLSESTTAESGKQKVERVNLTCACNRDVELDELMIAYPQRKKAVLQKFLTELNSTMNAYDIKSCIRKVHFLAQIGHESGELQYVAEILPKGVKEEDVYDGYKGRGLVQLTYKANYQTYGDAVGQDFLDENKIKLEETKWATDSAGWYWRNAGGKHDINLNGPADKNDMIFISASINGGFNGYEGASTSRLTLLHNSVTALNIAVCPQLDALFSAFPEMEKFTYQSYKLETSEAYDKHDMVFAWGVWHDPSSKREGVTKNAEQSLIGYQRYIELLTSNPIKTKSGRFGFKRSDMKTHAEARIAKLSKK
jgi:predicted chitinase